MNNNLNIYHGDYTVKSIKDIDFSKYDGYKDMSPNYFANTNVMIYEDLKVAGDLSLDWTKDNSCDIGTGYGLLIVNGDFRSNW